jgi:hypothetical protein
MVKSAKSVMETPKPASSAPKMPEPGKPPVDRSANLGKYLHKPKQRWGK